MGGPVRSLRNVLLALVGAAAVLAPPAGAPAQPFPPLQSEEPSAGPPVAQPPGPPVAAPADPPTPAVSLHVRAPASAAAGQEVDYRLLVENASRAAAHHVVVRSPAPANAAFVRASPEPTAKEPQMTWELGTLEPGASKEILLTLKPGGAGDVDVTARVQFEHGQSVRTHVGAAAPPASPPAAAPTPLPTALMPPAAPVPPAAPAGPALRVRMTGPAQALQYDILPFKLEVTNTGTADATDVELTDSLPSGLSYLPAKDADPTGNLLTWNIGTLTPGQTRRIEYQANALEVGDQENKAQATAAGGLREAASWRVRVSEPKLRVGVAGPQKRLLNRPAKYQITVTNGGAAPLAAVELLLDKVPPGVRVAAVSDNGRQEDDRVHWVLGSAPAGGRRSVTLELTAAAETEAVLHFTAKAHGAQAAEEIKTLFVGAAGLHVDIDKGEDPLPVGRECEYTIRVFNGGSARANNVQVTLAAPEQMQATSKEGTAAGRTVTFPPLAALAPGKEATYHVRLKALQAGEVKVVVEVRSDGLATPLHEEETATLFDAAPAAPATPMPMAMPPASPDPTPTAPGPPPAAGPPPLPGPPG